MNSRKKEIREIQRKLSIVQSERRFKWNTPKYQKEHSALLDRQEEKLQKRLEKIL